MTADQQSATERNGESLHEALLTLWPEAPTGLALARLAWGDDLHGDGRERRRRQQQEATLARYARWLPKPPPTARQRDHAERARRSGITDEQRQANADRLAAEMAP